MLKYLWSNRSRFPIGSRPWLKSWAKRTATFPGLLESLILQKLLTTRGAVIESPAFIAKCKLNGGAANLKIGQGTFVGRVIFHLHDRIDIGRNVVINDGVVLLTASHDIDSEDFRTTTAPVIIGDYAWIATGAVLLPGVEIGVGAVVGAGAVVRGRIAPYKIAIGNPAKIADRERTHDLRYDPSQKVAAFEAWLGRADVTT
jgi:maltose O-acetyltransferase